MQGSKPDPRTTTNPLTNIHDAKIVVYSGTSLSQILRISSIQNNKGITIINRIKVEIRVIAYTIFKERS